MFWIFFYFGIVIGCQGRLAFPKVAPLLKSSFSAEMYENAVASEVVTVGEVGYLVVKAYGNGLACTGPAIFAFGYKMNACQSLSPSASMMFSYSENSVNISLVEYVYSSSDCTGTAFGLSSLANYSNTCDGSNFDDDEYLGSQYSYGYFTTSLTPWSGFRDGFLTQSTFNGCTCDGYCGFTYSPVNTCIDSRMFAYENGAIIENKYTDASCSTLAEQVGYHTVPSCSSEADDEYSDDSSTSSITYFSYSYTGSSSSNNNNDNLSKTEIALVSLVVIFGIAAIIACVFWYMAVKPKAPLAESTL